MKEKRIGILTLVFLVLLYLKLSGAVQLTWLQVFMPEIVGILLVVIFAIFYAFCSM